MKLDARVRYTRRVIQEALLTLLEQKPLNKITVTELCALAQINRATFYAHYADCYAVLNALEDGLLRAFEILSVPVQGGWRCRILWKPCTGSWMKTVRSAGC